MSDVVGERETQGMLAFNRKTDYALISLSHLVTESDTCCSAREIATRYGMPMPLVMNVLKMLAHHGMVRSERGPRGGYQLAKSPDDITLHDIIAAVDGPVALVHCLEQAVGKNGRGSRNGGCDLSSVCPVRRSVVRIHKRLVDFLNNVTLTEIVENSLEHGKRPAPLDLQENDHEAAHLPG